MKRTSSRERNPIAHDSPSLAFSSPLHKFVCVRNYPSLRPKCNARLETRELSANFRAVLQRPVDSVVAALLTREECNASPQGPSRADCAQQVCTHLNWRLRPRKFILRPSRGDLHSLLAASGLNPRLWKAPFASSNASRSRRFNYKRLNGASTLKVIVRVTLSPGPSC